MAVTKDQQEILQALADMIKRSSGGTFSGTTNSTSSGRGKTDGTAGASQDILDANRANSKTLKSIEKGIKQIVLESINKQELKSIRKLPDEFRKGLEEVGTNSAKKMADSIKTFGDVVKVRNQIKAQENLINVLKTYEDEKVVSAAGLEEIVKASRAAGISFRHFVDEEKKVVKEFGELERETVELSNTFDKAANKHTRLSRAVNLSSELFSQHSAKLKQSMDMFIDETRLARERGAYDAQYSDALFKMGVNMRQWTTVLADNRNVQQAMRDGGRDFTEEMSQGSAALRLYSKDNEQALQTSAAFAQNIASMGVNQKNLGGALADQVKMYEDNFFIYGVTAEAFAESTKQLLADTDIRQSLAMMGEDQRKEYIRGIQAQEASRLALGYTTEQARELTKVFAKMGAESPRERMKKAAKMRALAGTLGLGAEGQELQDIMVNINQLEGPAKAEAIKRAEEIQRSMSNVIQKRYSAGLGSEFATRALVDKAGFNDLSKQLQTLAQEGKTVDPDASASNSANRLVPEILSDAIGIWDTISAFQSTSVGLLTSILAVLTVQTLGKGVVGGKFGGKIAQAGGGKMGAAKAAGAIAGKIAAPLAAILAGVVKYNDVADDKTLTTGQKTVQVGSTATGALGGVIAGAASGAAIGMLFGPIGAAIGGLVGGIGGGFAGEAVGEMVGEGISGIMDSPETKKAAADTIANTETGRTRKEDIVTIYEKTTEVQAKQTETMITAVKEMTTYIKDINTQNLELAGSVNKTAEVATEVLRQNEFRSNRP